MKCALVWSCLAGLAAAQSSNDCGNLAPCTTPNGTFVECQNPARRGCCKGLPYWLYNTTDGVTTPQACCEDAEGNPFISLGNCPTTTPTTAAPTPSPTIDCGNLSTCTTPNGTFVECQDRDQRGCCMGLPYSIYNTTDGITWPQSCCQDGLGNPFITIGNCPTPAPWTPPSTFDCGNLVACTAPNGTFVECQDPTRRGCCKGLPYWLYSITDGIATPRTCCQDTDGNPYIVPASMCFRHGSN